MYGEITTDLFILKTRALFSSPIFIGLLILIFLDIFSGYAKAIKQRNINSKISTNGWLRHILVVVTTICVGVYARMLGFDFISYSIGLAFVGSYGISFLENLEALGVPFPQGFKKFFEQMRNKDVELPSINIKVSENENVTIKNVETGKNDTIK